MRNKVKAKESGGVQSNNRFFMTKMETVLSVSVVVNGVLTLCSVKPVVRGCNSGKMGVSLFSAVRNSRHKHINVL